MAEYYDEEDYTKLGLIGSGSFGDVYKIEEKKTGDVYVLKTFQPGSKGYAHAESEINALQKLDHENIVKIIASSDITNRRKNESAHIVLEHMPCNLYNAIKTHPEIKENTREILHQILSGVAHIHSKKLVHRDIKPENILIDPANMSVKICDLGNCCDGEEEIFHGRSMDWYHQDILDIVCLMVRLYLGESSSDWGSSKVFSMDGMKSFFEAQRNGVLPDNGFGTVYKKMEDVVSKNGLYLFIKLIASERNGGCTTAAEALKHPFFEERHAQDASERNSGGTIAEEALKHLFSDEGNEQDTLPKESKQRHEQDTHCRRNQTAAGFQLKQGRVLFLIQKSKNFLLSCLA
ncbi:MAG: CMGC protein kinase [Amphiamblys sp. WSBS2006]|nr:MAG: CMGC protein kinase [Amphiamblys sp. WSBS2006]